MMTLYQYSDDEVSIRTVHWVRMKLIIAGVLIAMTLVGAASFWLITSDHPFLFPAAYALEQENTVLRAEMQRAAAALDVLDLHLLQIYNHDTMLNTLLRKRLTAADSVSRARVFSERIIK
jgi:hypothetical protein